MPRKKLEIPAATVGLSPDAPALDDLDSQRPRGRPKSLAAAVRAYVGEDGSELIKVLFGIAKDPKASRRDKTEAAKVLLDRGFGKSTETTITLDATSAAHLEQLPDTDLAGFVRTYLQPRIVQGQAVRMAEPGQAHEAIPPESED